MRPHVLDISLDDGYKAMAADIVSNDAANRHLARVVVVPLTRNTRHLYPGEALVNLNGKPGKAMADQIMTSDKGRLKNQIGTLSKEDMQALEDAILIHLGMPR